MVETSQTSLTQAVDWIIDVLSDGKNIEVDEHGNVSAMAFRPPRSIAPFTLDELRKLNGRGKERICGNCASFGKKNENDDWNECLDESVQLMARERASNEIACGKIVFK